jgi:predicted nucleotidyltransferase
MNTEFSPENLIKGKIAEVVFQQMFREQRGYTIIPFGYEYTVPQLSQCADTNWQARRVINNIKHAPDFALVSTTDQSVFLVEVKFMRVYSEKWALKDAEYQIERWDPSWIFIASLDGFYFDSCKAIIKQKGQAKSLTERWVSSDLQEKYLELLNKFEKV